MESSDQGKIKHGAVSKGGLALGVFLLYTVVLAHCFIRARALHNWRGGCCSGKVSLDLFSSALSSRCKLEQRQVLPAEQCEPNRQMSLLALEKSRTLPSRAGRGSSACQEHIPAPQGNTSSKS